MQKVDLKKIQLLTLILIQLFLNVLIISSYVGSSYLNGFRIPLEVVVILNVVLAFICVYLIREIFDLINKERTLAELQRQSQYNEKLSTLIRSIRHDMANHTTVVDSLYQLGRRKEALEYSKVIISNLDWISQALKLEHPEISSLLIDKLTQAKNLGIKTDIKILKSKDCGSFYPVDSMIRIMGNLMDNAIYALKEQAGEKCLNIRLFETSVALNFEVENTGTIDPNIQTRIFEKGFTTKGKNGNGLGLYIVRTLTESLGGKLFFNAENGVIKFSVEFSNERARSLA